jgi:hypothetical protein
MKAALSSSAILALVGWASAIGEAGEILSRNAVDHRLFAQSGGEDSGEYVGETSEERRLPPGSLYRSDTCRRGFVWREAFPNDHVCVPPDVRAQAARDNAAADARRQPFGGSYGPDTCR